VVGVGDVRALTEGDLAALGEERGVQPRPLKRLAERHHSLARALADGMSPFQAALASGYSPSRVSILQQDPTFIRLIDHYREQVNTVRMGTHAALETITRTAAELLLERMEDVPDEFTNGALTELVRVGADRTGHGPSQTNVSVSVDMASELAEARKRLAEPYVPETVLPFEPGARGKAPLIEHRPNTPSGETYVRPYRGDGDG